MSFKDTPLTSILTNTQVHLAEANDPLPKVLKLITRHKIHCVPVYDETKKKYVAFVDLIDFACHIGRTYLENEIIEGSVSRMLQEESHYSIAQVANESHRNPYRTLNLGATIGDALKILVTEKLHRVALVDANGDVKHLVTPSNILTVIEARLDTEFAEIASKKFSELSQWTGVISVPDSERLWKAFAIMNSESVSGVGVINDNGDLIGHIGSADLKGIEFNQSLMDKMRKSVAEFKGEMHVTSVNADVTFAQAVRALVTHRVHRVYALPEDSKTPIGVISQGDILAVVYNFLQQ
jgi:CBS-domain-containing membrane protein